MILEDCGAKGNGHVYPEEDPQGYHEPGASGRVTVLLNARDNGGYGEEEGLGEVAILSVR